MENTLPKATLDDLIEDVYLRRFLAMSNAVWFDRYADHEYGRANNGIYSAHCSISDLQRAGFLFQSERLWRKIQ